MAGHNVLDYLKGLEGQTFPPLLVEVLLKSGDRFFVKNVFNPNPELEMVGLRIWDLRAVEVSTLPEKLNTANREGWSDFATIDPDLDQANLWIRPTEIEGFVEWHERYWPVQEPDEEPTRVRFYHESDE